MSEEINLIAWWGAILSTLLALIKFTEFWRSRFRIDIGFLFNGLPELGNDIYVRNLTPYPVILGHWEVLRGSGIWPFRKFRTLVDPAEYAYDIRIDGYSSKKFSFREGDHFSWGEKALGKDKIYIRLYFAGRNRPLLKKVYG
jgi:hypothetical protein